MSNSTYRNEPDLDFVVQDRHVIDAECGQPERCTLALAGQELVGQPVWAVIEDTTGEVRITWTDQERFHRAYLRPAMQAIRVLLLTDKNKSKMVRSMPPEGIALRVERHQSRLSQAGTPEERKARSEREKERRELRKAGLIPPATPRNRAYPPRPRSDSMGMRGTVAAPARPR